jgi:hypothetical protein
MATRTRKYDDVDAAPKSDAYTGLLALSLIAMIASCVILYLDYAQYGATKAPMPNIPAVTKPAAPINQGAPAGGGGQAPNDLGAISAVPLDPPAPAMPQPIVPVKAEAPADDGPTLPPLN